MALQQPPMNLRVISKSHNSCTIQWDQPTTTTNVHIDAYNIQFRMTGTKEWIEGSSTIKVLACKKKNLAADTPYDFRVRAHIIHCGWGEWSKTASTRTYALDDTARRIRYQARTKLHAEHGIASASPLPTNNASNLPMPKFPEAHPPCSVLQIHPIQASGVDSRRLGIFLRRWNLLEDTFAAMSGATAASWARDFMVTFHKEDGIDYGALTREWILELLDTMANPDFGLFCQVGSAGAAHPSQASVVQRDYLTYFRIFGYALGKAFVNNIIVRVRLSNLLLKALLGKSSGALEDLEHFDSELHRNLIWMLNNDITDVVSETFSTSIDVLGEVKEVELIPNGSSVIVSESNKREYVDLKARTTMLHGIKDQVHAIQSAFSEMVPSTLLESMSVADLHVSLSGITTISVHDWKKNTETQPPAPEHAERHKNVVSMFWEIVAEMGPEQRSRLLYFATASAAPPPGGFSNLRPNKFRIVSEIVDTAGTLPSAHTCFCTLVLPIDIGSDYEKFRQKLSLAVSETEGFGIA